MADRQNETVSLLRSPSERRCMEYALVLLAMGIRCVLVPAGDGFELHVYAEDAARAREQIRLYVRENEGAPDRFEHRLSLNDGLTCAWLYMVVILTVYILQRDHVFAVDWVYLGMSQAGLVQAGEWWRAVTALGLHVDTAHLVSNLIFGALFVFLAGEMLGWGLAWAGILLGGSLGNLVNALSRPADHISIGASTAIFAAVGILAAYSWSRRRTRRNRWIPLGAGVALLAFIGMGGGRTDVFAHATGFGAGCLFGAAFGFLEARAPLGPYVKQWLGIGATLFFVLAWALALVSG